MEVTDEGFLCFCRRERGAMGLANEPGDHMQNRHGMEFDKVDTYFHMPDLVHHIAVLQAWAISKVY